MHKHIMSLALLTVSFYVVGAAQEPQQIPSLKELALQRVVQTMTSEEQAQRFARDPQKFREYVESHGINNGAIKELIVDQLLKSYKNEIYKYRDCSVLNFLMPNAITSVSWHPDGELLALGLSNGHISIWNSTTDQELNRLKGSQISIRSVAWHPHGELLAAGSDDKKVRIWNRANVRTLKVLKGHQAKVNSVSWHPNGALLASSGSSDGTVRIWDRYTGQEVRQLQHQDQFINRTQVSSVVWHPGGELLASGSSDGTVHIWDRNTGEELKRLRNQVSSSVNSVAWHPDGKLLAFVLSNDRIYIWDTTTGQEINELRGHLVSGASGWSPYGSVSWSPNGNLLASGSCHGVFIFDMNIGKIKERCGIQDSVSVVWNPKRNLLALAKHDGTICIWDVGAHERLIDSLSLMQALYFVHDVKYADVMQAACRRLVSQGKQEEDQRIDDAQQDKGYQDYIRSNQDYITRGIFFDLDQIGYEGYIDARDIFRDFDQIEESLPTLKRKKCMRDLEVSLPDEFKHILKRKKES